MARKCSDFLGMTLGADESELASLFRMTFRLRTMMENFQRYLVWQCYWWRGGGANRDKLSRNGCVQAMLICEVMSNV